VGEEKTQKPEKTRKNPKEATSAKKGAAPNVLVVGSGVFPFATTGKNQIWGSLKEKKRVFWEGEAGLNVLSLRPAENPSKRNTLSIRRTSGIP